MRASDVHATYKTNRRRTMRVGKMEFDPTEHKIIGPKGRVRLTPREAGLLEYLAEHTDEAVSRDELLACAWDWNNAHDIKTKTVEVHIGRLRGKLKSAGLSPSMVQTVRHEGYRLRDTENGI